MPGRRAAKEVGMIRDVVVFKLKPGVSPAECDRWLETSRRAHARIESVRAYTIGADLMRLLRSNDVVVVADFDTLEDV